MNTILYTLNGFHYVGKYGNENPVVFNYCYWVYSSRICRVALSSWQFLLMILYVRIVESTRVSASWLTWFLVAVLWTEFCTRCKQDTGVAATVHWSIRATGGREAQPALPRCVLNWIVQEPVQKRLQEIVIHSPTFSFFTRRVVVNANIAVDWQTVIIKRFNTQCSIDFTSTLAPMSQVWTDWNLPSAGCKSSVFFTTTVSICRGGWW